MKIINGKNVYIQKRDYNLLFETPEEVGYYIDCTNDLDFVLVNDETQKKYIKENDDIIDYSRYIQYSVEELNNLLRSIENKIINKSIESMKTLNNELLRKIELEIKILINKACSLSNLILIKENLLNLELPKEMKLERKKGIKRYFRR